jgi:hypothetical protein
MTRRLIVSWREGHKFRSRFMSPEQFVKWWGSRGQELGNVRVEKMPDAY